MDFIDGIGRLAFDRYDFQNHLTGTDPSLRHSGQSIELNPSITIDGYVATNVYSAIFKLKQKVETVIPDATTSSKGLIQLQGDISGTATDIRVTKIQGKPIEVFGPSISNGSVLTWDTTAWKAISLATLFGGDLSGVSGSQKVLNISGSYFSVMGQSGYKANISANILSFNNSNYYSSITQETSTSFPKGSPLTITAQGSSFAGSTGGDLFLNSGFGASLGGSVFINSVNNNLLQAGPIGSDSNQVLSLCGKTPVTTSNVYGGHLGDYTVFVKDCMNMPTGQPVGGFLLYSNGGVPLVKNERNQTFEIGTLKNPAPWAINQTNIEYDAITNLNHTVEYSNSYSGVATTIQQLLSFTIPNNTLLMLDIIVTGSNLYNNANHYCMVWKATRAFKNYSGTVIELKTNTANTFLEPGGISNSTIILSSPLNVSWDPPSIQVQTGYLGKYIKVYTGKDPVAIYGPASTNWTAVCKATYLKID